MAGRVVHRTRRSDARLWAKRGKAGSVARICRMTGSGPVRRWRAFAGQDHWLLSNRTVPFGSGVQTWTRM
jgi:hypothetical protein